MSILTKKLPDLNSANNQQAFGKHTFHKSYIFSGECEIIEV